MLGDTPADKSSHVFVIRRRLDMNGAHLRPVEDVVGQPMLQIPEGGSILRVAKGGLARGTLKLRIVHHQVQTCSATTGKLNLRARVLIYDPSGTPNPPSRQIMVQSWAMQR